MGASKNPSEQLKSELDGKVKLALETHPNRPILTHINADTTWLLQVPRPAGSESNGRTHLNILLDPWLSGPQSDVASWFSKQWHAIDSSVQTIAELDDYIRIVEDLSLQLSGNSRHTSLRGLVKTMIDVVVCSHEFTDHCHQATLTELDPSVPVFATNKAADLIRSWRHFSTVVDIPGFGSKSNWHGTSLPPLPSWVGIGRLVTKTDALYYHSAVSIFLDLSASSIPSGRSTAEAIIYTPHGIQFENLSVMTAADPPVQTLALLHGLHDVSIKWSKQLNLGAHNALKAQRILNTRYWVGTHDEVKTGAGLIAPLLRRKILTVQEALDEESRRLSETTSSDSDAPGRSIPYTELGSGHTLLLV